MTFQQIATIVDGHGAYTVILMSFLIKIKVKDIKTVMFETLLQQMTVMKKAMVPKH
jgi:hypothetical protein